jgi:hypothetical protein
MHKLLNTVPNRELTHYNSAIAAAKTQQPSYVLPHVERHNPKATDCSAREECRQVSTNK